MDKTLVLACMEAAYNYGHKSVYYGEEYWKNKLENLVDSMERMGATDSDIKLVRYWFEKGTN